MQGTANPLCLFFHNKNCILTPAGVERSLFSQPRREETETSSRGAAEASGVSLGASLKSFITSSGQNSDLAGMRLAASLPPPRRQHKVTFVFSQLCPACFGAMQCTSPQTSVKRGLNYFCRILRATLLINSGCIATGKYTSSVIFLHTFAVGVQGSRKEDRNTEMEFCLVWY